jgi:hypothetical protein
VFAHPELHGFAHAALSNDLPAVMGNDASDPVKLVRFDDELE